MNPKSHITTAPTRTKESGDHGVLAMMVAVSISFWGKWKIENAAETTQVSMAYDWAAARARVDESGLNLKKEARVPGWILVTTSICRCGGEEFTQ